MTDDRPRSGFRSVEPTFLPWRAVPFAHALDGLIETVRQRAGGTPRTIAVDGRSGAGKSTFADRLASALPRAAVVRTDDVAWHHSFFDWQALMIEHVLAPARRGRAVRWQPDAWQARGREGSIDVPAGTDWLVVEGVGAARHEHAPYLDAAVWVASDDAIARERGIARDGGDAEAIAFWDEWEAAERPFLEAERPWERADLVVSGTPAPDLPEGHVLVGG